MWKRSLRSPRMRVVVEYEQRQEVNVDRFQAPVGALPLAPNLASFQRRALSGPATSDEFRSRPRRVFSAGLSYSVHGGRVRSNNFMLDG